MNMRMYPPGMIMEVDEVQNRKLSAAIAPMVRKSDDNDVEVSTGL